MRPHGQIVLILFALAALGGPLLMAVAGAVAPGRGAASDRPRPPWPWRLTLASTLLYALAFDLVFILQEVCLVLAKAVTPGLHPVLFHNNHDWTGSNPLAELEQGVGALVILLLGLAVAVRLRRGQGPSTTLRLFLVWIAYHGLFSSLPQLVSAAALSRQDTARAMDYLGLPLPAIWLVALAAVLAMAAAGIWLARPVIELADDPARVDGRARRTLFAFQAATLPAIAGTLLILPYRVPGSIDQVVIVPVVVGVLGIAWIQASAWRVADPNLPVGAKPPSIAIPLAALAVVLAVFQLVLRPGVAF